MGGKSKKESLIALELNSFEDIVKRFQDYLSKYDVRFIEEDKKRHDEADCQIKIMNALPNWLAALERLRESKSDAKVVDVRGSSEMSGLMEIKMKKNEE